MKYSRILRKLFEGIKPGVGDLLLLESFQVSYLPGRVPHKEFAALIRRYPYLKEFLILKDPSIKSFLDSILTENKEITNLYVLDGFLESIQLPENSLDMLFTSNAIGWNIEKELHEIERVVKPNGLACHHPEVQTAC